MNNTQQVEKNTKKLIILICAVIRKPILTEKTGQNLPSHLLTTLTDWILIEILNDKDVDKAANSEFTILSPRQLRRRDKRENSVDCEIMDYLNLKYVKNKGSLA